MSSHRIERVNTLIRREISELIQQELRDPRLDEFVSVTEVDTSPDLKYAKIYVSSMGGQQEEAEDTGSFKRRGRLPAHGTGPENEATLYARA